MPHKLVQKNDNRFTDNTNLNTGFLIENEKVLVMAVVIHGKIDILVSNWPKTNVVIGISIKVMKKLNIKNLKVIVTYL